MITIIAVLAALSTAGIMRAITTARQTAMKAELDQLDAALKAYKEKYGSYPPSNLAINDASDPTEQQRVHAALMSHIARAFPRYNINELEPDLKAAGVIVDEFRPDQALVFWLRGFGPDVTHPFVTADGRQIIAGSPQGQINSVKPTPFFDFDQARLCTKLIDDPPQVPSYFPRGAKITTTPGAPNPQWTSGAGPFVYWDEANYKLPSGTATDPRPFNQAQFYQNAGTAVPYWNDVNNNRTADSNEGWANPDSFQIIATGMDGKYGLPITMMVPPRLYPTGQGYDPAGTDDDNISNFCDRARMGDAKP